MSSLESVWEYREETLYPQLFGTLSRGIFPIEADTYAQLAPGAIDPRWLHLGVLEYAPSEARKSWLYVTSGGSTPWNAEPADYDREGFSGLGVEYVLETPEPADWPIQILQWMLAVHVLASHRRLGQLPVPDYGELVQIGRPIDGLDSTLRYLALCLPAHIPAQGQLDSGKFDFIHLVGVSEPECNYGRAAGTVRMLERLVERGAAPVTDAGREPIAL